MSTSSAATRRSSVAPTRPASTAAAASRRASTSSSFARSRRPAITYGILEKQFHNYYAEASRRAGKTGDNLLQLLECRLDNVVYRAGFARTRRHARQLVVHGHFKVNGKKVDIPSFQVTAHDVIDVREKSPGDDPVHRGSRDPRRARRPGVARGASRSRMRILVHQLPVRAQIDIPVQEQLIVEYYSKK